MRATQGQGGVAITKPTPIASTKIGDQILELHLVERGDNRLKQSDNKPLGADDSQVKSMLAELGVTPWKETRSEIGSRLLLFSFLLFNSDGTLAEAMLDTATTYRTFNNEGVESSEWAFATEIPVEEMTGKYLLGEFPGAPLFVNVPPRSATLKSLEGFVLIAERITGNFEFKKEDFNKRFVWDQGLAVYPILHEIVPQGLAMRLGLLVDLRYLSRQKSQAPETPLEKAASLLSKPELKYTLVLPDNSTKPSNFQGSFSTTSKAQADLLADLKKKVKALKETGINRADELSFITNGKNLSLESIGVGFNDQKDFKALIMEYSIPTAPPKISRFVMENIPLEPAGNREALMAYVNQAKTEALNRREAKARAKTPTPEFRTWKDRSGNFSVDAKLVEVKADTVVLEKADGKQITVTKSKLSDADLQFLGNR